MGRLIWSEEGVKVEGGRVVNPARGYKRLWKEQIEQAKLQAKTTAIHAVSFGQITVSWGRTENMMVLVQLQGNTAHKIGHVITRPLSSTHPEADMILGLRLMDVKSKRS